MADEIGRMKTGELLRVNEKENEYMLEVGGETRKSFSCREDAIRECKVMMLKSWLPESKGKNIRKMLASFVDVEYNFMLEWCERQAGEEHDCDCGCWGYPIEMGTLWTWNKNKYRGCSECGEKIKPESE